MAAIAVLVGGTCASVAHTGTRYRNSIECFFGASTQLAPFRNGTVHVLMPTSAGKQLSDLPGDVLIEATLFCYSDL